MSIPTLIGMYMNYQALHFIPNAAILSSRLSNSSLWASGSNGCNRSRKQCRLNYTPDGEEDRSIPDYDSVKCLGERRTSRQSSSSAISSHRSLWSYGNVLSVPMGKAQSRPRCQASLRSLTGTPASTSCLLGIRKIGDSCGAKLTAACALQALGQFIGCAWTLDPLDNVCPWVLGGLGVEEAQERRWQLQ